MSSLDHETTAATMFAAFRNRVVRRGRSSASRARSKGISSTVFQPYDHTKTTILIDVYLRMGYLSATQAAVARGQISSRIAADDVADWIMRAALDNGGGSLNMLRPLDSLPMVDG